MRGISFCIKLPVVLLLFAIVTQADTPDEPYKFFREFAGLHEEQIAAIRSGKAVAKVVESPTPDEVYVFGSVYVEATIVIRHEAKKRFIAVAFFAERLCACSFQRPAC